MPLLNKTIKFVIVKNPFIPESRLVVDREFQQHQSLHDYIGELNGLYTIIHNGQSVDVSELKNIFPLGGDVIGIAPIPAGGGGGAKEVLRLVSIVAISMVTAGVGAAVYGGALAGLGIAGGSMAWAAGTAALVGIGGNMLINKLLPPSAPTIGSTSSSSTTSSTYGIDGAKNTSTEGIVTPITYGTFRTAGNIVAMHTTMSGSDQWLHMLINAGEGVIASFDPSSVQINEQPVSDFGSDAKVLFMHGNAGQNSYAEFSAQITPNQVMNNRDLTSESKWSYYESSIEAEVEALEVGLLSQLYYVNDNGNPSRHSVDVQIEYRPIGSTDDGDWADIKTGIRRKYTGLGWIFMTPTGETGLFDPNGQPVTLEKLGSQLIDPSRPNKYNTSSGLFQNYYELTPGYYEQQGRRKVWIPECYTLRGERVTPNGDTVSKIQGYYVWVGDRLTWKDKSKPEDTLAPPTKNDTSGLGLYDYGHLICGGKVVGHYHTFHQFNKSVARYNGSGLELGTKAAEKNITLVGSETATARHFFRSPRMPEGRYELRVRRIGNKSTNSRDFESIVFNEVNEIVYADINYNHTALLQLSIKATSNLSSVPRVTFLNKGRVIRVWDNASRRFVPSYNSMGSRYGNRWDYRVTNWERATFPFLTAAENAIFQGNEFGGDLVPNVMAWSRPAHTLDPAPSSFYDSEGYRGHCNPAWIVYDMMTDKRIGGGLPPSRLDFWSFKEWADYCEEKKLYFNGVFDTAETLWDQIAKVFRVGRASPIRVGTRYSVSIEKPSIEVMRFGQDNIKEGSFSVNWMSATDRSNEVEVTFYDKKYDYKQRVVKVYDQIALNNGEKAITSSMTLLGVTDYNQAIREANFALNTNKLVETVSFTTNVSALACTVGDVIRVQHNMMDWGEAGKIKSVIGLPGGQYSIKLDHPIQFDSDPWSIMVHHDFVSKGSFVVKSKADAYITLTGFRDLNTIASRVMVNGKDVSLQSTFLSTDGSGDCGICVDNPSLFNIGATVELFAVNTYETAAISPSTLSAPTDTVIAMLPTAPTALSSFMIGKLNYTSKLFTVRSITLASDSLERVITALEYDERVFDDTNINFLITEESAFFALGAVQDVNVIETSRYESNVEQIDLSITWSHKDERYKEAAVYVATNRTREVLIGKHIGNALFTARPGDDVVIRIVPYDAVNKPGTAKKISYEVQGTASDISSSKPTGGTIVKTSGGSKLKITVGNSIGVKHIEVWAIVEGTLINGEPITSVIAADLHGADVEQAGKLLGYANDVGDFVHVAETEDNLSKSYYYFSRTISYGNEPSDVTYIGVSKPVSSIIYNNVSVYALSAVTPATPTGGTYADPKPTGTLWSLSPPTRPADDTKTLLWMSTRRFCNFIESQDPVWSEPTFVSMPDVLGQISKTWVAYATDPTGTDISFTYDPSKHLYRGLAYNRPTSETPSLDPVLYTWTLIVFLTDIVNSEQRDLLNALKEGKFPDQSTIVVTSAMQSSIDAAVDNVMADAAALSDAAREQAKDYAETQRSVNWLKNAAFEMPFINNTPPYWSVANNALTATSFNFRDGAIDTSWGLNGGVTNSLGQNSILGNPALFADVRQKMPAVAGVNYGFSVYTGSHRCKIEALITWHNTAGTQLGSTVADVNHDPAMSGGTSLTGYKRLVTHGVAPANTSYAYCVMRKYDTDAGNTNSYMMFTRAQFGEWAPEQSVAPAWCPGFEPLVANNSVISASIADNAVSSVKIAAAAVTAAKTQIAAINAVNGELNANTVGAAQMLDGAVSSLKLADAAVTAAKTSIAAIDSATGNLKAGTVNAAQLVAGAVDATKIAAGAVDATKTSIAAIDSTTGNLKAGTVDAAQLVANAVTAVKIAAGAVDATKTALAAIDNTTGNLKAGTVGSAQISDSAITATKFASGIQPVSIVATLPAVAGYTGPKVVLLTTDNKMYRYTGTAWVKEIATTDLSGTISTEQVAANAIDTSKLANNAVTDVKIVTGAVTAAKLSVRKHMIY